MKKQVFKKETMLKGGLHCHTTRSDGKMDPASVIRLHKKHNYDFLALTDHRIYNYENFAPETGITIIPGMEYNNKHIPCASGKGRRCYHILCYGPSREEGNGYEQDEIVPAVTANTPEAFQPTLDTIHQKNNVTIYCHPEWSSTPARYFDTMKGNFAMEIWNSGCVIENGMDADAAYWDELLGQGIHIFGVATDDGHYENEHCNGWVMVNAENNVNAILKALQEGDFYSSCGPDFYSFSVDDNKAYIDCSAVKEIRLHSDGHSTRLIRAEEGKFLEHAEFNLKDYYYVRASIIDKDGHKAWTNPIFLD